jgi:integrase
LTLAQFLDQWLDAGASDWKAKTLHGYKIICDHYWKSELGSVQLQKLTPAMLSSCYTKWRADRAGGTVLNAHRCIRRALVVAVRLGYVSRNIADAVEPPKAKRRKPALWSREQAIHFLAATREDRYHVLWSLLLGTGARLGEIVALRWSDVDLDAGTVEISRSLVWMGKRSVEGAPKTESGVRVLSLPPFALVRGHLDSAG